MSLKGYLPFLLRSTARRLLIVQSNTEPLDGRRRSVDSRPQDTFGFLERPGLVGSYEV
jgi:hypothetical protein